VVTDIKKLEEEIHKRNRILDIIAFLASQFPENSVSISDDLEGWRTVANSSLLCVNCQKCKNEACPVEAITQDNRISIEAFTQVSSEKFEELPLNQRELAQIIQGLAKEKKAEGTIDIPANIDFLGRMEIDLAKCINCEKCVEICPMDSMIPQPYYDLPKAMENRRHLILPKEERKMDDDFEPLLLAIFCQWCTYGAADLAGTSRMQHPSNFRVVRVPCTGKVDPLYILRAFELGVDGVIISGCLPNQCHYVSGNFAAEKRIKLVKGILDEIGFGGERLEQYWISASMAPEYVKMANEMTKRIQQIGPNPKKS
jgi:coenzyme F420-reducing hydrogenase delta subunit/Fe-S-cluster-containing hydrogenase component 2